MNKFLVFNFVNIGIFSFLLGINSYNFSISDDSYFISIFSLFNIVNYSILIIFYLLNLILIKIENNISNENKINYLLSFSVFIYFHNFFHLIVIIFVGKECVNKDCFYVYLDIYIYYAYLGTTVLIILYFYLNRKNKVNVRNLVFIETSEQSGECIICMQELDNNVVSTNCCHKYHKDCIEEWSKKSNLCPICRNDMTKGLIIV